MAILDSAQVSTHPNDPVLASNAPFALAEQHERRTQTHARGAADRTENRAATGTRVLLVGRIRELALYRAEVLRTHGYRVLTPSTVEEAMHDIRRGQFDVAVLTYTLSSDVVEELTQLIREYRPEARLVAIADRHTQDRKIRPDETILADDGPAALISALRRLTQQT